MPKGTARNANDRELGARTDRKLAAFREASQAASSVSGGEDGELSALLAAVAAEIHGLAGMERAGILADYGARIRYAQRHFPRQQAVAMVRALKEQQRAALAHLKLKTAMELKGRLSAIRRQRARLKPPGAGL